MDAHQQLENHLEELCTETPIYIESAVDWISATCRSGPKRQRLRDLGEVLIAEQTKNGETVRQVGGHGYRGHSAGPVTVQERPDTTLITISGGKAHEVVHEVVYLATNVTRLDVQVTAVWELDRRDWAEEAIQRFDHASRLLGQPRTRTLITTEPAGTTAYFGSRSSDRMARIYDKAAESRGEWPDGSWRWEIQSRREVADSLARDLVVSDDLRHGCIGYVHGHFKRIGCCPPWRASHVDVSDVAARRRSDPERKLRWLDNQIGPVIEDLLRSENGQVRLHARQLIRKWIMDGLVAAPVTEIGWRLSGRNGGQHVSSAGNGATHAEITTHPHLAPSSDALDVESGSANGG